VEASTNVTFRIVNFGGTSSRGTWCIFNTLGTTAPDLAIQGTVALCHSAVTNQKHRRRRWRALLSIQGVSGHTYWIQAATNLNAATDWQTIGTNVADMNGFFQFIDSQAASFRARYYRAVLP